MKKIALIAAVLAAVSSFHTAQAATATGDFNVSVNLLSQCRLQTTTPPTIAFGDYTAFTTTAGSGSASLVFECTRGFTARPTVAFDVTNGTTTATSNGTATGEGVLSGLRYTLSVDAVDASAGNAATAGAGGTGGSIGTADTYSYTINGAIPAGQAGTCAAGSSNCASSHVRTLIITY